MKTVGKQLQEARLAKNWTPELAARETKIKIERLRDLEADDYSQFSSPTYARGFVRTYARALGLDEYKILRQLDNKLPDDDTSNIVTDGGVAYLPETSMPPRAAHRDYTGLYVVMGLGAAVALIIVVVLFEAYRVGELPNFLAGPSSSATTTNAPAASAPTAGTEPVARALPVDSNTPPPIPDTTADTTTNAPAATAETADNTSPAPVAPRALPVDPSELTASNNTVPAPDTDTTTAPRALPVTDPTAPPRALPVDPSQLDNPAPADNSTPAAEPPRALPVTAADLAADSTTNAPPQSTNPPPSAATVTPPPDAPPADATPDATPPPPGNPSNTVPAMEPAMPPMSPTPSAATSNDGGKRLVLTASQDSFVRVTELDSSDSGKPLYSAILRSGQSVGFDGHKFSINVGVPSAVDIRLDGVNYGPHSDHSMPETFNVESHLP